MTDTLYKVLGTNGSAYHGGTLAWPLPNGKPGRWVKVEGELVPCRNGLHLCTIDQLLAWLGPTIWVAEAGRERIEQKDKIVARRARLVAATEWNERTARLFACDCAERALKRERKAGREPDERSWEAIRVARLFANGETGYAARDAARDAAWAAARAAARAAAWDAARDAERRWQAERLLHYLGSSR